MGYFDEDYVSKPKKKRRWLVPAISGLIVGIVIVFAALPGILNSDILPESWVSSVKTGESGSGSNGAESIKNVSVDVSSQITDIVDEVSKAVVGVINIQRQGNFWEQQEDDQAGTGSGVIYKKEDGYAFVVTNHHVIEGADTVEVVLSDDTRVQAEILGSDLFTDLAVLRMKADQVKNTIEFGDSANVKVGEPAIAVGNPLGMKFSGSVTTGVISGKHRTIPQDFNQDGRADWQAEVIQTDAAINPGNSGGALINIEGQLIGINSMKINETSVEGIGFAIPVETVKPIIKELENKGEITRPYIGVEIYSLNEVPQTEWDKTLNLPDSVEGGVYVWSVDPLSPADQAGLKRLDVITKIDGQHVMNMIDLRKILYEQKQVGDTIKVTFYRDGKKKETKIKLGVQE